MDLVSGIGLIVNGTKTHECAVATKVGAIVSGQTSVKAPEKEAFEKYLPDDVSIVSLHSLHGPTVNPSGQALVSVYKIKCDV